jgi:NAD(P)H-flavin reductase
VSAERKGIVDPDCVTNMTDLYAYINGARVSHKFVRQFFNPQTIMDSNEMEFIGEQRMESDFGPVITPTNYFLSQANEVSFYQNKYFDFSSFSFIPVELYDFFVSQF